MSRFFGSGVSRPLSIFSHRTKVSIGVSVVLASLAGVPCATAYSQSAYLSGAELTIPLDNLAMPEQIAVDATGNLYIADSGNGRVLKMTYSGGAYAESVVATGLLQAFAIAVDSNGNIYVGSGATSQILKETPSTGGGYTPSVVPTTSSIPEAGGLAVDGSGNLYIADTLNNRVLKETLSGSTYTESTLGSGMSNPNGIAVDASGNVYVSDTGNHRILKETLSGGSYTQSAVIPSGISAEGIALDAAGNLYIADYATHQLSKYVFTSGGYGQYAIPTSVLDSPTGIAVDSAGNVYIAQAISNASNVLKELPTTGGANVGSANVGTSSTGITLFFTFNYGGTIGKPQVLTQGAAALDFNDANTGSCTTNGTSYAYYSYSICGVSVAFSPTAPGNRYGAVVLVDNSGNRIATGYVQGTGVGPQVNFAPATRSTLSLKTPTSPYAMAADAVGNLYITQTEGLGNPNSVVKESWTGSSYTETTVASGLSYPVGVAVDGAGNVYIADQDATKVIKETPTSAGGYTQTAAFTGLGNVESVAVDSNGNVYIGSLAYHLIKETPLQGTYAGSYTQSTIDSGAGIYPWGIAVDGTGNVYFSTNGSDLYEEVLSNGSYARTTIATNFNRVIGVAIDGNSNLYVADIGALSAFKETPSAGAYTQSTLSSGLGNVGIAVDGQGNVYTCGADAADGAGIWKLDFADPPSLSFATTIIGTTSSDSPKTVTVENAGNAALSFPVPAATGNNPNIATNFSLNSSSAGTCPLVSASSASPVTLAAGASCNLPISFTPSAPGNLSGSLTLTDNAFNPTGSGYATQTVLLTGTATGQITPTITWAAPSAISYGTALTATQLDATSTVPGTFIYSPAAGTQLSVGSHTLSVTLTPTNTTAYTIATATTSIEVNQATPSITWGAPASIVYGTALSATQLNAAASVGGTFTYSPAAGMVLNSGSQTLSVTFTPTDTTDYTAGTATTTITVSPAAPTLSFTAIPTQPYGVAPFAVSATSASSGAVSYAVVSGPATTSGNMVTITGAGTVVLGANQAASGNYSTATTNISFGVAGPVTVATTTGTPTGVTVTPGATATFALTLTPGSGTATLIDPETMAATGLPTGATAIFSPSTVAKGSGATSVTLMIQTPVSQTARSEMPSSHNSKGLTLWGLLVFPLFGATCVRKRLLRNHGLLGWLVFGALLAGTAMGLTGCSSGSGQQSNSSPQSYTVVVTATDQTTGAKSSANLTLTVQ